LPVSTTAPSCKEKQESHKLQVARRKERQQDGSSAVSGGFELDPVAQGAPFSKKLSCDVDF
jgi:hypothetical protein